MFAQKKLFLGQSPTAAAAAVYIEDVFSTYLYAGTGATQTITNGVDLSGKGGLVWTKNRTNASSNQLFDTLRGATNWISSNTFDPQTTTANTLTAFNANGFTLGAGTPNSSGSNYASWSFRKQAKFFDVVTYTGNGSSPRSISHSLGSAPGAILVKRTDSGTRSWAVYHRSLTAGYYLALDLTDAALSGTDRFTTTAPTSSVFYVGGNADVNANGGTYVAYLFAHDAGGFGAAGTDNVISCGSYTGTGSPVSVTLGWEPQFVLVKRTNGVQDWAIMDTMRGYKTNFLNPNTSGVEDTGNNNGTPTATGFIADGNWVQNTGTYIYIAIRRGPMKTPTLGTSVFGLSARTGTGANATVTGGQTDDAVLIKNRGAAVGDLFASRLTGTGYLETSSTAAEVAAGTTILQANPWDVMDGVKVGTTSTITNASANTFINYLFRRAPGFFDVVCYTGDGVDGRTVNHNLGVVPELMIVKPRSGFVRGWTVYLGPLSSSTNNVYAMLNTTAASVDAPVFYDVAPTSTVFTVSSDAQVNNSTSTYVAYLFATVAGVSKVGSYTGTGTTKQIDCGFAAGARFVLIKRTDSTGDWYVWDSARGIVAGDDPYLLLNSTAAEVTNTDYVDTYSAGFEISSTAPAAINANGGTFIFLAIA